MTHKYINELIKAKCAPDLLLLKLFPNAKEVTESFGAYNAVRTYIHPKYSFSDKDIIMISVGDGSTPRTAALFAFMTGWNCISIDPRLKNTHRYNQVKRLTCLNCKGEDIPKELIDGKRVVIIGVHSHGPFRKIVSNIAYVSQIVGIVAIPCCCDMSLWREPNFEYDDENVWSGKRKVMVWI